MSLLIAFNKRPDRFIAELGRKAPGRALQVYPEVAAPADVRYAIAWKAPHGAFRGLPNLRILFSYGAGVDHLLGDPYLPAGIPIVRLVEPELTQRMSEYVILHTLLHHRRMTEYFELQRAARWHEYWEPLTQEVRVGIMGLGVLGRDAALKLKAIGYQVAGWSRTPRQLEGIETYAGASGLDTFLSRTEILVILLPLTSETRGIVDRKLITKLARNPDLPGPVLINAGRGELQNGGDILAALESGALYAASLDVFETEPLPAASRFWSHPRVIVTPHNASNSPPSGVADYVLAQIARFESGAPLENVVDPVRGY